MMRRPQCYSGAPPSAQSCWNAQLLTAAGVAVVLLVISLPVAEASDHPKGHGHAAVDRGSSPHRLAIPRHRHHRPGSQDEEVASDPVRQPPEANYSPEPLSENDLIHVLVTLSRAPLKTAGPENHTMIAMLTAPGSKHPPIEANQVIMASTAVKPCQSKIKPCLSGL